jgi:uncharacterized protein YggE
MIRKRFVAPLAVAVLLVTAGCLGGVTGLGDAGSNDVGVTDEQNADRERSTISVGATGEVTAEPDRAILNVGVEAKADDPETARERVAENVSTLRDALADVGLDSEQVTTQHYTIREDRESRRDDTRETTYRAIHQFEINVENVDEVGTVIETAVNNGATNVGRVQFTLSEESRANLRERALSNAMSNARHDAELLADNANLTIVDVKSASTGSGNVKPYRAEADMATSGANTDIESGPVSVSAQVQVTYNATS